MEDSTSVDAPPPPRRAKSGPLGRLAGRFGWALVIEVLNLFTSAFIFLVLAQFITIEEYGRLGALTAIAAILGPISIFGSNWRLLRKLVITVDSKRDLGMALSIAVFGTTLAIGLVALVSPAIVPSIDRATVAIYLVGQLTAFWLIELAITYTVGVGRLQLGAGLRVAASTIRFLGLFAFIALDDHSLRSRALVTAVSGIVAAFVAHLLLAMRTSGLPRFLSRP